jgi:hypothetical protein
MPLGQVILMVGVQMRAEQVPEHDPEKWVPVFGKKSCSKQVTCSAPRRAPAVTLLRERAG